MSRNFVRISKEELEKKIIDTAKRNEDIRCELEDCIKYGGEEVLKEDSVFQSDFARTITENLTHLTSIIEKDIKVWFDTENIDIKDDHNRKSIVGFHTLDNGLTFLGVTAGGDWQFPLIIIFYYSGECLRAYIPTEGNPWNTDTMTAYGDDTEKDIENLRKRLPNVKIEDDSDVDALCDMLFDPKKIIEDIKVRIVEKV